MAKPIDLDQLMKYPLRRGSEHCDEKNADPRFLNGVESILEWAQTLPTLTPPNEWVSVETPPTTQGWYHVAVLDLKTGKYTVEQDLYSIELAKAYGFEPGFCKANRREERERIDYWCRFPEPPDRRQPEGEEDNND